MSFKKELGKIDAVLGFEPFIMKFHKSMFEDIPMPYPYDYKYVIYTFCDKNKIKTEEPRGSDGTYFTLLVHITCLADCLLFQEKFSKVLRKLSNKFK